MTAAFALSIDGMLCRGDRPIPGVREFMAALRARRLPFRFVTNNSAHVPAFYAVRLNRMGFGVGEKDILSSAVAAIRFLKDRRPGKTVWPIATPAVCAEIAAAGVPISTGGHRPDIVLLAFDTTVDYEKLNAGYHYLQAGAELIAIHPDDVCPTEDGYDVGIGPFIRLFEFLTGKKATAVGKPHRLMLDMAAADMGVPVADVIMVGDRLSADMHMAVDAGARSILVLSEETDRTMLEQSGMHPTWVVDSVRGLIPWLAEFR
ncbi:MAG: HAD-IIA family hydrolase [Candidatus Methanomethylophilus sp.]|nr:HAD-IIA family hydrolase [Methanomethylophilus sp.]MDD4222510.1 HAD-IIA family hydrolase [Methanomethylophilus sp.]MDD4669237.1 HAD-IIA family hydrolase [Methanomethylophilus sp.]